MASVFERVFEFLFKYRPIVFEHGELAFGAPLPVAALLIAGAVVTVASVASYRRAPGPRERVVLAGLRIAALALVLFCLFRPTLLISRTVPQQNYLGILIDDSRSMRIADGGGEPRGAFAQRSLGADGELLAALAERFQLRLFRFSSETRRLADAGELTFTGSRTQLGPALERARQELGALPLAGLVLVSDGADNAQGALTESLLALEAAGVPVFTVGLGSEAFAKDVELGRVVTPRSVLRGSSLAVEVPVVQRGYAGRRVQLFVEDEGRIVSSQEVELPRDGQPATVRVHLPAAETGPRRFRFRIPPQDGELIPENNQQEALVQVQDRREKVLYFEGEPRFEVKFLRRAVADDDNLQVVVLQRSAENKFLRLDVDSAAELASGFPTTREELFAYRGLILGSVEASFFTHEQLRIIADFVGQRGGGLLMLGGRRSFAEGGYAGTPLADVLPVVLDGAADTTFFAELKVGLTRAGRTHPTLRIAEDDERSAERWRTLPPLSTRNRVQRLKPGATALLTGSGADVPSGQVVLAHQRYGRGNAFAFPVQDSWLWQMHAEIPLDDMTHENLWRQLLRWLVSEVPGPVDITLAPDRPAPGEPVRLSARVHDERYLAVNNGRVLAHVTSPSGSVQELPLEWTVDRDGEYRASFTPEEAGLHEVRVEAVQAGRTLGQDALFLEAAESMGEFFDAQMRAPLLRRIAAETGGRFYTPATVASLPEDISYTGKGLTVVEEKELWDMPVIFLLLLGLVATEWGYRRARGLA